METFLSPLERWKVIVQELKFSTPGGKKYFRTPAVAEQIQCILRLHQSEWILEAPNLKNETIVFLMLLVRRADEQLFYEFFRELCARIVRIAKHAASGYRLKPDVVQEIVEEVELQVLQLVLSEELCRQSEVLEFVFGVAVKRRVLNRTRKHNNSVQAHLGWIEVPPDYDGSAADEVTEPPLERRPDTRHSPEEAPLWNALLKKAWTAIDDPRIIQALFLHYHEGWPLE